MKKIIISILIVGVLLISGLAAGMIQNSTISKNCENKIFEKTLEIPVSFPDIDEFQIVEYDSEQRIELDGFNYLGDPGRPMLLSKNILFALPPRAKIQSVEFIGIGVQQIPGNYQIMPTSPIISLDKSDEDHLDQMNKEWQDTYDSIYYSDDVYPSEYGKFIGSGALRKFSYISVSVYPFRYQPDSGHLFYCNSVKVIIDYKLSSPGSLESEKVERLKWDTVADEKASELFFNYNEMQDLYQPFGSNPLSRDTYDYVIVTTTDLVDAITSSNFINWKTVLGYNIKTVYVTDAEITEQSGQDLAEQIRNFLRQYYSEWSIEYVLIVGDYETVPMRYCYPNPGNHENTAGTPGGTGGEVPTDYYYADLSSSDEDSWDSDGDGYYGEYVHDNPDFAPEVYVGRIPVNDLSKITYALDKIVAFEQDTGSWKNNALHAGAFFYFSNETAPNTGPMDGARHCAVIENDFMSDWTIGHYSEQEGLEHSIYEWDALTEEAFTSDWRTGQYAIVNWGAHGWSNSIARKIWAWDDGDGIPEANEMSWPTMLSTGSNLDDDYPSIVTSISCYVGYPEPNDWGNMGIDLLTRQFYGSSVGVISSARTPYGSLNWPEDLGGSESIMYEFNNNLINKSEKVGEAFYNSKFFCNLHYGWSEWAEYCDMYTFNLFGDPSLDLEGFEGSVPSVEITKPEDALYIANFKLLPFFAPVIFGKIDIEIAASDDESEIECVEVYIDGELKTTITEEPYQWRWSERVFGKKTITVKAQNSEGFYGRDDVEVWKFF